jgi:hypothetical protein
MTKKMLLRKLENYAKKPTQNIHSFTEKLLEDKDVVYILIDDFAIVTNGLISNTDGYTIYEALRDTLAILVDYYQGRETGWNSEIKRCI